MTKYNKEKDSVKELDKVLYATYTLRSASHLLMEKYGNIDEIKELNVAIAELKEFLGHNGYCRDKGMNFVDASTYYLEHDNYSDSLFKAQETVLQGLKWSHLNNVRKTANKNLNIIDLRMKVGYNNSNIKYQEGYCCKCNNTIARHKHRHFVETLYECQDCYDLYHKTDKFYKILEKDMPPYTYTDAWPLPKNGQPGEWLPIIKGPLVHENNGYHLCNGIEGFRDWISGLHKFDLGEGMRVFEVEFVGESIVCGVERIVRTCRLTKETKWNDITSSKLADRCLMTTNIDEHNKILYEYLETGHIYGV